MSFTHLLFTYALPLTNNRVTLNKCLIQFFHMLEKSAGPKGLHCPFKIYYSDSILHLPYIKFIAYDIL